MTYIRIIFILLGLLGLYNGIRIINIDGFYWWGLFFSAKSNKYFLGTINIGLGILFLVSSLLKENTIGVLFFGKVKVYKCIGCGELHRRLSKNRCCKNCGAALEPLEGFFQRHPEFKTKSHRSDRGQ